MSDEEKEALEILNNTEWDGFMITIKNLIEKQSKEIKELKNADLTTVYLNGVYDGEKKVEDKIKAKIEPVLKQLERKMQEEYNKYGNSREYQDIVDAYNFLQSLLEKE